MKFKLTLKARLAALICFLSLLCMGIGLLGLYGINSTHAGLKSVYEERTVGLEQISRIDRLLVQNQLALAEALQDSMDVTIKLKSQQIAKNNDEIDMTWDHYWQNIHDPDEFLQAKQFVAERERISKHSLMPAIAAMQAGNLALAADLQDQMQKMVPQLRASIEALRKHQVDKAKSEYEHSLNRYINLRNGMMLAILSGLCIAVVLGWYVVSKIYRQLGAEPDYAATIVRNIAQGDLTENLILQSKDQHSLMFDMVKMQHQIAVTVGEIRESADTIASAASQIASGNLDLSTRTEQQASLLEETSSSMEDLSNIVRQNAQNAMEANTLAMAASNTALKGGQVVAQVVSTMSGINHSAKKIVDIISVIDGIAFQTNILALNAAVEAARAGEQGRGFAVVAGEVRNLAQRSTVAAKEIKDLIGDSVEKVNAGSILVDQAGQTMDEIVASVSRVTAIMAEMNLANQEQHTGIAAFHQAVSEIDRVTQQNAAMVEEASAAATCLHVQTEKLMELVSVFKLPERKTGKADIRSATAGNTDSEITVPVKILQLTAKRA